MAPHRLLKLDSECLEVDRVGGEVVHLGDPLLGVEPDGLRGRRLLGQGGADHVVPRGEHLIIRLQSCFT